MAMNTDTDRGASQQEVSQNQAQKTGLSRRGFLMGAGLAAATATTAGLFGCSTGDADGTGGDAANSGAAINGLPESWDYETDVLVVGHGGAGIAAGLTMASESLGEVLVIEAAPAEQEGGNTRVSGNLIFNPDNVQDAITYQTALNDLNVVEPELLAGWAENVCGNKEWLENLGIELVSIPAFAPEFPELPGSSTVKTYCVGGKMGYHSLWNALKEQQDYYGYEVLYNTRGLELVRNRETNEALGVIAEQNGTSLAIKARKGVVLSLGGFENNPEMLRSFLGMGQAKYPLGTPFNRGDGFAMVAPFGAQLWHMNNAAGSTINVFGAGLDFPGVTSSSLGYHGLPLHDYLFVGRDGKRFMYEETNMNTRHGKIVQGGVFVDLPTPEGAWAIFGQTFFDNVPISTKIESETGWSSTYDTLVASDNQGFMDKGVIVKAETIEELAEKTGLPLAGIQATLDAYAEYVVAGKDPDFRRGESVYDQFGGMAADETAVAAEGELVEAVVAFALQPINPPYYATPLGGCIYNTQGGPKRNGDSQLLTSAGEVIPRLYGAGEFGTVYGYMYNGGGNVSDALGSGRAAARHAASLEPWDA
jgi:succinate dehydrogenase/fumarate reductase flavoprotein subunit